MELPERRRNYFIDRRLQGIWALLNLAIAGIVGLLSGIPYNPLLPKNLPQIV